MLVDRRQVTLAPTQTTDQSLSEIAASIAAEESALLSGPRPEETGNSEPPTQRPPKESTPGAMVIVFILLALVVLFISGFVFRTIWYCRKNDITYQEYFASCCSSDRRKRALQRKKNRSISTVPSNAAPRGLAVYPFSQGFQPSATRGTGGVGNGVEKDYSHKEFDAKDLYELPTSTHRWEGGKG